jgi:hypothetical protein
MRTFKLLTGRQSAFPFFLVKFYLTLPLFFFSFISSVRSQSTTTVDYTQTFPIYNCNAFAATPNIACSAPKNTTLQHISVLGQPVQATVSATKCLEADCSQQTTQDQYGNPVVNVYGTEYLIKYNFQKGYNYTFTFTLEAGTNASITGFPTLYLGLTNTSSLGTDCLGPEAPVNIQGDNQLVTGSVPIPAFTGTSAMNVSQQVNFNNLSQPYQFLQISDVLPGTGNDGTCQVYIKNLTIIATSANPPPSCSLGAPGGLEALYGGSTLSWNAVSGAASYKIAVTDGSNVYNLTSTTNTVNFCSATSGDHCSFTVQPVCSNGAAGTKSGASAFTFAPASLPAPTNVSFNSAPPFTVSWSAVTGATGYWYQTSNSAPVFVSGTSITDPDAELSYGQTYQIKVASTNGCTTSAYSTPIQAVMPPSCTAPAPTSLTTSNNGSVLNWNAVSGAASYEIVVTDVNNGTPDVSTLTSTTNSVSFCPAANGDNVSFTVQSVCGIGSFGVTSSAYSYTYTAPALTPPTVTFNPNYPYTVSWTAVAGATGYWYQTSNSAPVFVSGTSITDPDAELSNGQTYQVSVAATNGCATGSYSSPLQVVMPAYCAAPTVAVVEGTYILLYAVSGAATYNLAFENSSGQIVQQINNIPTSITTSGYEVTGVPSGYYYVIAQTNCTSGSTGPWGAPFDNSLQYVSFVTPLESRTSGVSIPANSGDSTIALSVYPNPSRSQANVIYNTPVTGKADLTVITEFGNTVIHKAISTVAGQNSYTLDISQLANGVYFLKLTDGKNIRYQKLVVAK